MTIDEQSADSVWGAPQSTSPRWGKRQTVAAVGVAAVIAGLGGAAIYAATDGSSSQMGPPPFGAGGPGGHGGPGGPGGMPDRSLHAESVVRNPDGGYRTELTQTGMITQIDPNTVTVRSEDGYTQTYQLPHQTAGSSRFMPDDRVTLSATRDGQTVTVTDIDVS